MKDPKILLGIDLSVASIDVLEILIEDTSEPDIFDEIAHANIDRHEILEFLFQHPNILFQQRRKLLYEKFHLFLYILHA